jgi:predicted transposase/invertase (TIGR01784 family)
MSEYKYEVDTQSKVVTARREGLKRGVQKGLAEGVQKGRVEGRVEVAKNMIKIGLPLEQVAKATGLDLETVKSLARG